MHRMTERYDYGKERRPFDLESAPEPEAEEDNPFVEDSPFVEPERPPWEEAPPPTAYEPPPTPAYAAEDVVEEEKELDDLDEEPLKEEPFTASRPELKAEPEPEPEPEPEFAPEPEPDHAPSGLHIPSGYRTLVGDPRGEQRSVAVVVSRFNREITNQLLTRALEELERSGVMRSAITILTVPGAFELPLAAMALGKTRRYACVVALGCVIRGETPHFDYVASEAASGLQLAALETGTPVSFGVLTCETQAQAEARLDRGTDAARSALEMADVFSKLRAAAAG
jgi:6,7-dimethyl-8-ribityllumazine synthase